MKIGGREFDTDNCCYIMGILNVTPDSFSDGGKWASLDSALRHTEDMILNGADIIDIGGESTRPGYQIISDSREIDRIVPVIEAIRERFDTVISADTYKSDVAKAAITAGASLINDIWGLKYDPNMAGVIAANDAACCLMHNRNNMDYTDFIPNLTADLKVTLQIAKSAGIPDNKIILDPGIGFAKTFEMNLSAIKHLGKIKELGFPVLLGTSKKSVIGTALQLPVTERLEGTIATSVIGVMYGCAFLRVHDVRENRRAVDMTAAVLRG